MLLIAKMPSPLEDQSLTIISRFDRESDGKLKQFLSDYVDDTEVGAVTPNRTKCYSQDDDCSFYSIQAMLGEDTADKPRSLLNISVDGDWNKIASELEDMDAVSDDYRVVSDEDIGVVTAFSGEPHDDQVKFVHFGRTLDYYFWDDDISPLNQRNEVVSEVVDEVFYLKNSVAKHHPNDRTYRENSVSVGSVRIRESCGVSLEVLSPIVTFAKVAVEGFEVSWTMNSVERLMGESTSGVRTSESLDSRGTRALLQLQQIKYANTSHY